MSISINEHINQCTYQSMSISINEHINQGTYQSMYISINEHINQCTYQSISICAAQLRCLGRREPWLQASAHADVRARSEQKGAQPLSFLEGPLFVQLLV